MSGARTQSAKLFARQYKHSIGVPYPEPETYLYVKQGIENQKSPLRPEQRQILMKLEAGGCGWMCATQGQLKMETKTIGFR